MVKTQPFRGFTLPAEFFQNYLENNTENIILKENNNISKDYASLRKKQDEMKHKLMKHQQSIFIYEQSFQGKSSVGIIVEVSIEDYHKGSIKKHQRTLNKVDRDQNTYKNALINPVTLGFDCQQHSISQQILKLENVLLKIKIQQQISRKFAEWKTKDGRNHSLWVLNNQDKMHGQLINQISSILKSISCLYILDGHHRFDAAHKNYLNQLANGDKQAHQIQKKPEYWIPGFIYPQKQVQVYSQHRMLKTINPEKHFDDILKLIEKEKVQIEEIFGRYNFQRLECEGQLSYKKHDMVIVSKQKTLGLRLNNIAMNRQEIVSDFLDRKLLMPIFNHQKDVLQKHLSFIPGIEQLTEHIKKIKNDTGTGLEQKEILFLVKPLSIKELFSIADRNEVLPPKSTWLEPKPCQEMVLRSLKVFI